jgi:hypothetical protein
MLAGAQRTRKCARARRHFCSSNGNIVIIDRRTQRRQRVRVLVAARGARRGSARARQRGRRACEEGQMAVCERAAAARIVASLASAAHARKKQQK